MNMHGIADLEIVEFASVLAGPLAANLFSEMGAKVTKIENSRTGGDITRHWRTASESKDASVSSYYASANFQKEVIMADLRDPAERERAMRYVDKADVIISNFKPDTARKLGVSFEALRQRNAKAVIAELVGYRENPERGAFDVLLQAEAGYLSMTGHPHSPFAKIPVAMIDILAAHQLRAGILAALYQRLQDGKGRRVEVDLYSAALSGLINQGSAYLMHQDIARPMGSAHPSIVPYGEIYHTLDDVPLVLAIGTDAQFRLLCELLGIDSLPHWSTNKGRVEDREELQKRMSECIVQWKYSELRAVFTANEIPFARVNDVGEALSQNKAAKYILESEQEDVKLRALRSVTFTLASE
jgi:crotonobetainyl-CoA:carnitine CoA-transferase CaiB-like acyl-CoA transferase